jgi:hypothetical protein
VTSAKLPAIVKSAERAMREIELAVARFPRAHKYALGADLRREAMAVARLTHKAWREIGARGPRMTELSDAIDDLKLRVQIAQQVHAFASFGQFELILNVVSEVGRQCGGWRRRRNAKGQNGQASQAPEQRPSILSSRNASHGART